MSEVLQANIFFLITGIAVIIISALLCVALYHVIKITKSVRRMVDRLEAGAESLGADMRQIRLHLRSGGIVRKIIRFLFGKDESEEAEVMDDEDETATSRSTDRKRSGLKVKDE